MEKTKVIKRYQNRKLYDTDASCYVTLDEIAEMIQQGQEVTVIDNQSQKNITATSLTQIICEKQKRSENHIPISTLRYVIKHGKDCLGVLAGMGGGQAEVIEVLESQVRALSAKLEAIENSVHASTEVTRVVSVDA